MCSYDALICPCPVIGDWVRIDQSQADCSREHDCAPDQVCPIGDDFLKAETKKEAARPYSALLSFLVGRAV